MSSFLYCLYISFCLQIGFSRHVFKCNICKVINNTLNEVLSLYYTILRFSFHGFCPIGCKNSQLQEEMKKFQFLKIEVI